MQNSLKSIIREAFNTAYEQYKTQLMNEESSAAMANRFNKTPEGQAQKKQADKVIDILSNQRPGWEKYRWDPSGISSQDNLDQQQWNYIVESLTEMAIESQDPKYSKIFSNIYTVLPQSSFDDAGNQITKNSAAYNYMISANEVLRDVSEKNPSMVSEALASAWEKVFYTDYWWKLLNSHKTKDKIGSNFGRLVTRALITEAKDILKSRISKEKLGTTSLDAPSNITGKSTDVEDGGSSDDFDFDSDEDGIKTGNKSPKIDDEEDHYNDNEDSEQADIPDRDSKSKKTATLKYFKFQKAVDKILNSAKTMPLTNQQQQGVFALGEILHNFKTYDEIALEFPNMFAKTDEQGNTVNAEVKLVQSRLKSILNKVAAPMLKPYGVTPDIFADPQWQTNNELPTDIVDQIIKQFDAVSKAGTSEKRQYTHAFREYAQNHLTPEQIAEKPAQGVYNKEKRKTSSAEEVYTSVMNLNRNQKFEALADSILHEFGFPVAFDSINWSDYWKAGKELQALQNSQKELSSFQKENYEEFLAKNLDLVMERVYNRLSKLL